MSTHAESNAHHDEDHAHAGGHSGGGHALKLMPFFLALSALTAAEVALYEWWVRTGEIPMGGGDKVFAIPKFALVLLILVFTLPKAYIVLVYFMHIRFEKAFIVWLAVIPLMMTFLAVLPTLTDTATLKERKINHTTKIGAYEPSHKDEHKDSKEKKPGDPTDPANTKTKPAEPADDYN
jgi:hypothetical protein